MITFNEIRLLVHLSSALFQKTKGKWTLSSHRWRLGVGFFYKGEIVRIVNLEIFRNSITWEQNHNMYMYIDQNLSQWGFEPQSPDCIKSGAISIYTTRTAQFLVNSKNWHCMYIARHEEAIISTLLTTI